MFTHPTLKVVFRKDRVNSRNEAPLYLQFTLDRKVNRLSLNMYVPLKSMESTRGGVRLAEKGKHKIPNAKETNFFLDKLIQRAKKIILYLQNNDEAITFSKFKDAFLGVRNDDFFEFHSKVVQLREEQDYSTRTIQGYWKEFRRLKEFRNQIYLSDIDHKFLDEYSAHLKKVKKNDVNTIWKSLCYIRLMMHEAMHELIDRTPFSSYKLKYVDKQRNHLSYQELGELYRLYESHTLKSSWQNVLQYFLFSCYTGLDYGDIITLKYSDFSYENGRFFIDRCRAKNGYHYIVPVTDKATALIDLEGFNDKSEELVFRVISNQRTNSYLKEIMTIVNIQKTITYHTARHTFGKLSLNLSIPKEVVQKMMGHQTIEMTSNHAKALKQYVYT
ncbi:MAG: site-specific integrase [Bacteroidota bacterium]